MMMARIAGVAIHYRLTGRAEGRPLVLANSLGTDLRVWDEVVERLGSGYRVLCYDKRGHGLSDAPPAPYRLDDHVGDLLGLLDHLAIERFGLVGLSVGGMIAQRLAARCPERVGALALCDTAARIGSADLWNARIGIVERDGMAAIADAVLDRWFAPAFRTGRADQVAGWRNMLVRTPAQGYAGTCAAIRDADLEADAATIRAPTLCIAGSHDQATPPELVRATAALIPGASFATIADAGHLPPVEQPAALTDLLRSHFEEAGLA